MDLRKIKKLIELLEDSALTEMEITEGENTIRLSRAGPHAPFMPSAMPPAYPPMAPPAPPETTTAHVEPMPGLVIKSPLVGTYYNAASPEDKPYVSLGAAVGKGDTLCLIEAMKTFNQLDADVAGVITVIHKNNGDPVEYGEPLFVIEER